jgi:DNA-binding NarL/FixJ family response regulator
VLTTFNLDEYVYAALRAGASGFLLKDVPPADLLTGIRVVAIGDAGVGAQRHPSPAGRLRRPPARPIDRPVANRRAAAPAHRPR